MPKVSEKQQLLQFVENSTINNFIHVALFGKGGQEDDKEIDNILEDSTFLLACIEESRYTVPFIHHSVPKAHTFSSDILPIMDDGRFKQFARCSKTQFKQILNLIENDAVFNGAWSGKQLRVELQLMVTLYRLGGSGEGATIAKIAALFGIGDGGTIQIITEQVFSAILKLKNQFVFWPDMNERKRITEESFDELPFCIGYVDGTEIKVAERPFQDPEAYISRKSDYCLKLQAVCDKNRKIRHAVIGYPGSVHDARIFNNCDLAIKSEEFFDGFQWIAGDSAYRLTKTVLTPFRSNAVCNATKKIKLNKALSKYRIRIEHTFGQLKERFGSLKNYDCN